MGIYFIIDKDYLQYIRGEFEGEKGELNVELLSLYMDANFWNLSKYMWLRRLNLGWN